MNVAYTDTRPAKAYVFFYGLLSELQVAEHASSFLSDTSSFRGDTELLLSTAANRAALEESMAQAAAGEFWTGTLEELADELDIDLGD